MDDQWTAKQIRERVNQVKAKGRTHVTIAQYEWLLRRVEDAEKRAPLIQGTMSLPLQSLRERTSQMSEGVPIADYESLLERLGEFEKEQMIRAARDFIELANHLDEVMPEWRRLCKDRLDQLREAIEGK